MRTLFTSKLVLAATAAVLLGGGAVAIAATQSSSSRSPREAYLEDVAKHLGVAPEALRSAMKAAALDRIDAAVASGRLSPAKAATLKQRIQEGKGLGMAGFGAGLGRGGGHGGLKVAATYLGVDVKTLRSERRSGRSLAQIAASTPGKSVEGLKQALLAAARARLAAAVSSGRLKAARSDQLSKHLSMRIEAMLTRAGPPHALHGQRPGGRRGHG